MNPSDSVKAAKEMETRFAVAKHFGCWQLTDEGYGRPERDLERALSDESQLQTHFLVPKIGGTYRYEF